MRIKFQSVSIGGVNYKKPYFLKNEINTINAVNALIDYFEAKIGGSGDNIDRHYLMDFFEDKLIGQTVTESMLKWFYNTKSLQKSSGTASLWRKRWLNYMTEHSITWIDPQISSTSIKEFASSWNVSANNMVELLFQDHTNNYRIQRVGNVGTRPNHKEVLQRYNTDILLYLFSKSNKMKFSVPNDEVESQMVKTLIRNAKFWGIFVELQELDSLIFFEATGPEQLIGKPTKYGKLLYALFNSILSHLNRKMTIFLNVSYANRQIDVCLPLFEIPSLIPVENAFTQNLHSSFDSKIEQKFSREFSRIMPHWKIQNEEVLVKNSRIFIPDFVLSYRNKNIYLEIVGFWTETYLKKKIEKIKWFSKYFDNIILLVDEKLEFPNNIVPTFRYGKRLSLKKLKEFIYDNYEQIEFDNFIKNLMHNKEILIRDIEASLKEKPVLGEEVLSKVLGTYSVSKTKEVLVKLFGEKEEKNFIVITWANLIIEKSYLNELRIILDKLVPQEGISEEILLNNLKIDQIIFDTIISIFGYSKKFTSLTDVQIFPGSQS